MAARLNVDGGAAGGGEHQQAHDGIARDFHSIATHHGRGIETLDRFDEFCRGTRVQPLFVNDVQGELHPVPVAVVDGQIGTGVPF